MRNEDLLTQFGFESLPEKLRPVAAPFAKLAGALWQDLPHNIDTYKCIRELAKSRGYAIHAALSSKKFHTGETDKPVVQQEQDAD